MGWKKAYMEKHCCGNCEHWTWAMNIWADRQQYEDDGKDINYGFCECVSSPYYNHRTDHTDVCDWWHSLATKIGTFANEEDKK